MRPLRRPVFLFVLLPALLCGVAATTQSQPAPGGGANLLFWGTGSPSPQGGGVDVTVTHRPTTGWTCTDLTVRVIDDETGRTLAEDNYTNPGEATRKLYAGLGGKVKVRVAALATFKNAEDELDFKDLEETVTTNGLDNRSEPNLANLPQLTNPESP